MRAALGNARLLGGALRGSSWANWRVLLIAAMGEQLTAAEREIFRRFTGRWHEPGERVEEALFLIGRRGGKDHATAVMVAYLAALVDWSPALAKGETGLVLCIGADVRQAKIQRDYIEGVFDASLMLSGLVVNRTADAIELSNGIVIEVRAASFRRLRGLTCVAVIATEAAFWLMTDESSNPDVEILNSVRPSLATTGGPLVIITTPYARRGEVWNMYRQHFGPDGHPLVLVAQGTSRDFNPSLPQAIVDRALERDHAAASAEYLATFRVDIEAFIARDAVEGAVIPGRHELLPASGVSYVGFVDPSGGVSDAMTLAIAHRDQGGHVVLDAVREAKPPFSPEAVCAEFATVCKSYGVSKVIGDRYAGEWPRERFHVHGIRYEVSERPKSDIYRDLLPMLNSGKVELLDHPRLVAQLCSLERRTARSGRESIDHARGTQDDIAIVVAGALVLAQDAVPALWRAESFAVTTATAAMPVSVGLIFATVVVGKTGTAGVAYFARSMIPGSPLVILDVDQGALSPALLQGMGARLTDFSNGRTPTCLFAQAPVKAELERLGFRHVEIIDYVLADPLLNVAAAVHVSSKRVQLCAEVMAKDFPLGFLHGAATPTDDDPLSLAVLAGIVLLDENRTLKKPRAA
jgi:hypothetical protein